MSMLENNKEHQSRGETPLKQRSSGPLRLQATISSQFNDGQFEASPLELYAANKPGWRKPASPGALICRRMVT